MRCYQNFKKSFSKSEILQKVVETLSRDLFFSEFYSSKFLAFWNKLINIDKCIAGIYRIIDPDLSPDSSEVSPGSSRSNRKFVNAMGQVERQYETALTMIMQWADADSIADMEKWQTVTDRVMTQIGDFDTDQCEQDLKNIITFQIHSI